MATSILTDAGGQLLLDVAVGSLAKPTFKIQLFKGATTPNLLDSDVIATYTEFSGGGYVEKTLNAATVSLVDGIPTATWETQTWIFTENVPGDPIQGYRIISGTTLVYECNLVSEYYVQVSGDQLNIIPRIKLGNGTPT